MAEHEVDKQLEGRLFELLEEDAGIRLGQLVQLRRRARSTGTTLLFVAVKAGLIDKPLGDRIARTAGLRHATSSPSSQVPAMPRPLGSVGMDPITSERPSPVIPPLRPPPLPSAVGREARRETPALARAVGRPVEAADSMNNPRSTVELLPPHGVGLGQRMGVRNTMSELNPDDETGPFDALDDYSLDEGAPPISIHDLSGSGAARVTAHEFAGVGRSDASTNVDPRKTQRSWGDTDPPMLADDLIEIDDSVNEALLQGGAGTDRYVLGEELGRGGMGEVLSAEDANLQRPVALKLLLHQDEPAMCMRFIDEARVTGQLQHPSVPPVYELGRLADGRLFFSMKRIEGRTLRDIIEDLRHEVPAAQRSFGRVRLLNIFARICQTIAYAHSRQVMHRDLKPDNVMLGEFGEITVMDWGLAKPFDAPERPSAPASVSKRVTRGRFSTQAGDMTGTPHYMPPEQAAGKVDELGAHSDIYSLGAVLYELLTLEPPFDGPSARAIRDKVINDAVVPPSHRTPDRGIPHELEVLCLNCLRKSPVERPSSAAWIAEQIESFLEGEQDRARKAAERAAHVEAGSKAAEVYYTAAEEHRRLHNAVIVARARTKAWDTTPMRRLWQQEDDAREARLLAARALSTALAAYHAALGVDGDHGPSMQALAGLYYSAFESAERDKDSVRMAHYETLVQAFDAKDEYEARLKGDGQLEIGRLPPNLTARLYRIDVVDRVCRPARPQVLASTPVRLEPVPMGSYLVELSGPGLQSMQVPVFISRRERLRLRLRLFPDSVVGSDFAHIVGGPSRLGGDRRAQLASPATTEEIDDFFLGLRPVTALAYLEFLNTVSSEQGRDLALQRCPRIGTKGPPLWPVNPDGTFRLPEIDALGNEWHPDWPVVGISAHDAEAYCAWMSDRTGEPYRLPTETEWEKAARGADGRLFPWGDRFEAAFCHMGVSRPGAPRRDPQGGFPVDVSPYGVEGMAGGVSEWTASWLGDAGERRVVKGGNWSSSPVECRAASRFGHRPEQVTQAVGFRVARDAPG
ncbi:MAG: sulfatase activating formylglycine-generating enzyme [Bradymonadia bacterium]